MSDSNPLPIVVLGAGGHAKVVIACLRCMQREITGIVTPHLDTGNTFQGVAVIGDDDHVIRALSPHEVELVNGIGSLPGRNGRWRVAERFRSEGYRFATLIHPRAIIADDLFVEEGVQIMAGAVIQPGVGIGRDSIVNTGAIIDHDSQIGRFCHIAPGAVLSGGVSIGAGCHIGTGVSVIQGITIGAGSVVGAGGVVYRDLAPDRLYTQRRVTESRPVAPGEGHASAGMTSADETDFLVESKEIPGTGNN